MSESVDLHLTRNASGEYVGQVGEVRPPLEFRVLWVELIAGWLVPFAGRVYSFTEANAEAGLRRNTPNCRNVVIEVRAQSQECWPNPLDSADLWLAKAKGVKL